MSLFTEVGICIMFELPLFGVVSNSELSECEHGDTVDEVNIPLVGSSSAKGVCGLICTTRFFKITD